MRFVNRWIEILAGILIGISTLMSAFEVFTRSVFGESHFWIESLIEWFVLCATWLIAGSLLQRGGHVAVQVAVSRLPPPARRATGLVVDAVGLVVSLVFAWWVVRLIVQTRALGLESLSGDFSVPEDVSYIPVAIGALLLAIGFLQRLRQGGNSTAGDPADPSHSSAS